MRAQERLRAKQRTAGLVPVGSAIGAAVLAQPPIPQARRDLDAAPQDETLHEDRRDPFATLVPEAEYRVIFDRAERGSVFGRTVFFAHFRISEDGPHHGKPILRFYNAPRTGRPLARSSSLWRDFVRLTGRRPPFKPPKLSALLSDCEVLARVSTVKTASPSDERADLPEGAWYSKIAELVKITAGCPPILRGSREGTLRRL